MRLISILLFLLISSAGYSQIFPDSISYLNDLNIYRQALEQSHPSLYRFTPKEKYDALFDTIISNLNDNTTELDFFRSVSQISSLIREGHSYVRPSKSLSASLKNKRLFPFRVLVEDDHIIVQASRSAELEYLKKAAIYSINGQSIKSILKALSESTCTVSAFNTSGLKSRLSLYNNFALAYYYFIDTASSFQIDYRPQPSEKTISREIEGSSDKLTQLSYPELPPEPKPPFYLEINEQRSLATMRISTFAYWIVGKKIKDYSRFFMESFISLQKKGIKNLIIDVRGNRGGEEILAGELLTYLVDREFNIYKYCKSKTLNFSFTNSLPESDKIKLVKSNYLATDSGFVMKKADFLNPFIPNKNHKFEGKVFVFSNGICASACNTFLALIKTHKVGKIIGQESGGAFGHVDGRLRVKFTLPYSKIFVSYPAWSMRLDTSGGNRQRGVIPDYEVKTSIQDLVKGHDAEMVFLMQLLNQETK